MIRILRSPVSRAVFVIVLLGVAWAAERWGPIDGRRVGRRGAPYDVALDASGQHLAIASIDRQRVTVITPGAGALTGRTVFPEKAIGLLWSNARQRFLAFFHYWPGLCEVPPEMLDGPESCFVRPGVLVTHKRPRGQPIRMLGACERPDGHVLALEGEFDTFLIALRVLDFRLEAEGTWTLEKTSERMAWDPHGYGRGRWPLAYSARRDELYVGEPGTGRILGFDRELRRTQDRIAGEYPKAFAIDDARGLLYVADQRRGTLAALDTATLDERASVAVGAGPIAMALAADGGTAWVANQHSDEVVSVDLTSFQVSARIPCARRPSALAYRRSDGALFVSSLDGGRVERIDTRAGASASAKLEWLGEL